MVCESRNRVAAATAGLVVLLLVLSPPLHGQVRVDLSSASLAVGEQLTYEIQIDYEEPEDVSIPEVDFPGFRLVSGPSIRPVLLHSGSERSRVVEARLTFEAAQPGRYVLEPIALSVAGQRYETPARLVEVGQRGARDQVPFLARWVVPTEPLVVGESAAVILQIFNSREFVYPSEITVAPPEGAIFEEVQGLGENAQRTVDGVVLYEIPVAVFMVTPSAPGTLQFEPARVEWEALVATAPAEAVEVTEAPPEIEASGAVGDFSLSAEIGASTVSSAETVELTVRLSGSGNLHFLQMPDVSLEGFVVDDDRREEWLIPGPPGYTGFIEEKFTLRPVGSGEARVSVDSFAYYDPSSTSVRRLVGPSFQVTVTPIRQPAAGESDDSAFALLDAEQIAFVEPHNLYRNPAIYGLFAPGLLILIITRLWRRNTSRMGIVSIVALFLLGAVAADLPWREIDRGIARYESGEFRSAVHSFERAARESPESPGIQHNLAVLYFQIGDIGRSVFAAREAVRLNPLAGELRETLDLIENEAGLDSSVTVRHVVHPDLIFVALLAAVNLLFVSWAFPGRPSRPRRAAFIAIGRILVLVSVVALSVGLAVAVRQNQSQVGVARVDLSLQRIPSVSAESWLDLPAGSAVEVIAQKDGFVLVETDLGLEGWVRLEQLLWPGNPALDVLRYRAFGL